MPGFLVNPLGIEPRAKEPESFILSIKLRVREVEMEGVEPSSKQGTPMLSTCLFRYWFSCRVRERTS